jgi:hypothetical protein
MGIITSGQFLCCLQSILHILKIETIFFRMRLVMILQTCLLHCLAINCLSINQLPTNGHNVNLILVLLPGKISTKNVLLPVKIHRLLFRSRSRETPWPIVTNELADASDVWSSQPLRTEPLFGV